MVGSGPRDRRRTTLPPTARERAAPRSRTKPLPARKAAVAVARALDAMKGEQVTVLDVGESSPITELFVFATGSNARHVRALAEEVIRTLKRDGIVPGGRDGIEQGYWAVVDYGPLVVHVFQAEARDFYDLEMLWGDGKKVRWAAPRSRKAAAKAAEEE